MHLGLYNNQEFEELVLISILVVNLEFVILVCGPPSFVQRVPQSNRVWVDGDSRPLPSISVSVLGGSGPVRVGGATGQSLESIAKIVQVGRLLC